jgi:hypothetical protein
VDYILELKYVYEKVKRRVVLVNWRYRVNCADGSGLGWSGEGDNGEDELLAQPTLPLPRRISRESDGSARRTPSTRYRVLSG